LLWKRTPIPLIPKWDFGMSILGENKMNEFKKNINFDDYDLCAKFNDYIVLKKR